MARKPTTGDGDDHRDGRAAIERLVDAFAAHIRELKSSKTKEAAVRQWYIDPFWDALGWRIGEQHRLGPSEAEVVIERSIDTVEGPRFRSRRPDYIFRINGFTRFIVEAKKPFIDLDRDHDAIYQAKLYAWNAMIPFAILTDFEQFRLYETTFEPNLDQPDRGRIDDFAIDYGDYPAHWQTLLETFGREAVAAGSLEELRRKRRKARSTQRIRGADRMLIDLRGEQPVDRVFLEHLDKYRKRFADVIYRDNRREFPEAETIHGAAKLTETVQRLMDRLVFMRVCEDRDIAEWGGLRSILDKVAADGGDLYDAIRADFRRLDREYNGYLFKPSDLDEIKVDGELLASFIRNLYPPDGSWQFEAISDDILGIVYERFLGNTIEVKRGHVVVEVKPEYRELAKKTRHKTGVFYTPRFVVDSIVRRVVGEKIKGLAPLDVLDEKILDPACGSGSFLVAALQHLFEHCENAIHLDPALAKMQVPALAGAGKGRKKKADIAFQGDDGKWYLAPDFRAAILTNCIHGVDIDQQAVEVTVMSLYLKMLESKLPENWQKDWVENRLLPPLEKNIQCGNSLISPDDFRIWWEDNNRTLFDPDEDTKFRINTFDWHGKTRGFAHILGPRPQKSGNGKQRGFDCIIGNPPYIRVQELNKWAPEECAFYKWNYKSAKKGNYDIYVVFTEKALSLLASDGLLGFIMPHKFWQAHYGEGLRKIIADGKHLCSVVDFRQEQVFRDATTYTAIHVFTESPNADTVAYAAVTPLTDGVVQLAAIDSGVTVDGVEFVKSKHPDSGPWSFIDSKSRLSTIMPSDGVKRLSEVARLAQGIKTSADKVFVLEIVAAKNGVATVSSAQTGKDHRIEKKVLWSLIKSEHMKRFAITPPTKALLFPYQRSGGRFVPIPVKQWESDLPLAWRYLNEVKEVLQDREKGRMKSRDDWYVYIYPKNFDALSKPKLVIPDICEHIQVGIDVNGEYIFSGGGAGGNAIIPHRMELMLFLCGVLNSRLIEGYLRQTGTKFRGGYLNCEIRFIRDLPIKLPDTPAEKKIAERITQCVRKIMDAKATLRGSAGGAKLTDSQKRRLESSIEALENQIDEAVFTLYGIDGLPT